VLLDRVAAYPRAAAVDGPRASRPHAAETAALQFTTPARFPSAGPRNGGRSRRGW
jgi:hypothetical protein